MTLSRREKLGRERSKKSQRVKWLEGRLDTHVAKAEAFKRGSKMRLNHMLKAEHFRDELRILSH